MKNTILAILALVLVGSATAGVSTDLVRVDLTQSRATLLVESTDEQPARFEAAIMKWTPAGLQHTDEVAASPRFFAVAARTPQQIQLLAVKPRGDVEGTYRLVFTSLDGTATLSVPVFLPPASVGRAKIVATRDGKILTVKNVGNVTQRMAKVYQQNGLMIDVNIYLLPGQMLSVEADGGQVLGDLSQNSREKAR